MQRKFRGFATAAVAAATDQSPGAASGASSGSSRFRRRMRSRMMENWPLISPWPVSSASACVRPCRQRCSNRLSSTRISARSHRISPMMMAGVSQTEMSPTTRMPEDSHALRALPHNRDP